MDNKKELSFVELTEKILGDIENDKKRNDTPLTSPPVSVTDGAVRKGYVDQQTTARILNPKMKNRWRVRATGELSDIAFATQIISCTRPAITFEEIQAERPGGGKTVIAGRHQWEPMIIKLEDDANGLAIRAIERQIKAQINDGPTDGPNDHKFDLFIDALNGSNNVTDTWTMTNCWIASAGFDCLDYSSSDAVEMVIEIIFDHAQLEVEAIELDGLPE